MSREKFHLLTPEQRIIAEKWELEREERSKIIESYRAGTSTKEDLLNVIDKITPSMCEHSRSIWSNCSACDEIERIIRPEAFKDEEDDQNC